MIKSGRGETMFLQSLLVQMYGKCGTLQDALELFGKIHQRNVFSWNFLIGAYTQQRQSREVLQLFCQMLQEGVLPDKVTFVCMLSACALKATLSQGQGKRMHAMIVHSEYANDVVVGNALVNMHGKSGSLEDAQKVLDTMLEQDVVSWTSMIGVYAQHARLQEALQLFYQMQQGGFLPDEVTYVNILEACSGHSALAEGERLHVRMLDSGKEGKERGIFITTALVKMYGRCGNPEGARGVFDEFCKQDLVLWTAMITVYAQNGLSAQAFELFDQMQWEGFTPDKITFISILSACACQVSLAEGKWMHARILESGFETNTVLCTAIINMYGKCGTLWDARRTFDHMPERNVVTWNAMISIHVQNKKPMEALKLFQRMQWEGEIPDRTTFISVLEACTNYTLMAQGKHIHACIRSTAYEADVAVATALVNMHGKCGNLEGAWGIFNSMYERNVISWNAMIAVCAQKGQSEKAFELFAQMQEEGARPDIVTFITILDVCTTYSALAEGQQIHAYILKSGLELDVAVGSALVNFYCKCAGLKDAHKLFDRLPVKSVVSWSTIILGYAQNGDTKHAFELFDQMWMSGVMPNKVTFVNILDACSSLACLIEGRRMHACIVDCGFESNLLVGTALVNMYGKCGSFEDAWRLFEKIPERDLISWNAMITVVAQYGLGKEALLFLEEMQEQRVLPNVVTFVSILSACSHAALIDAGCHVFASMLQNYGMSPDMDHYICMIDLLGRSGQLDEAESLVNNMPIQPTAMSFVALLSACRYQADVERAERTAKHVFELDPGSAAPHVMLSNIYAACER